MMMAQQLLLNINYVSTKYLLFIFCRKKYLKYVHTMINWQHAYMLSKMENKRTQFREKHLKLDFEKFEQKKEIELKKIEADKLKRN